MPAPLLPSPSLRRRRVLAAAGLSLAGSAARARPELFPQTCHVNGRPEPCLANAYGLKQDPGNDVEIWWADGALTTVRHLRQGPLRVGEPVLVDGSEGRIHRVRSCSPAGEPSNLCTQITLLRPPGTLFTYVVGD